MSSYEIAYQWKETNDYEGYQRKKAAIEKTLREHPDGHLEYLESTTRQWKESKIQPDTLGNLSLLCNSPYRLKLPVPGASAKPKPVSPKPTADRVLVWSCTKNEFSTREVLEEKVRQLFEQHPDGKVEYRDDWNQWCPSSCINTDKLRALSVSLPYRFTIPAPPVSYVPEFKIQSLDYDLDYPWNSGSLAVHTYGTFTQQGNGASPTSMPKLGDSTMSTAQYSIPVLTEQLTAAKEKHAVAIAEAKKAGESDLDKLMGKFKADGKAVCSEEGILLPTANVTVKQYEDALAFLSLLSGDTVDESVLPFDTLHLIKNAGVVTTGKKFVEIRSFS